MWIGSSRGKTSLILELIWLVYCMNSMDNSRLIIALARGSEHSRNYLSAQP
jgi:hypothetical protein